nr:hypothetical protein Iba_chr09bCG12010 [Ipomoea batatas]
MEELGSGDGDSLKVDDVPPEQQLVLGSVKRLHRTAAMAVSGGGALRRSSVGAAHQQIANIKRPPWDSAVVRGCGRSERSACNRGEGGGDMVLSPSFRQCKVAECPGGTPISVRQLQRWRLAVLRYGAMVAAAARVFSFWWAAIATASNPARLPSSPPSSFPGVPLEPTHDRASFSAAAARHRDGSISAQPLQRHRDGAIAAATTALPP